MEEPTIVSSFLDRFFRPQFIESFQSPLQGDHTLRVTIFPNVRGEDPLILDLNDLYPFMTIQDIKTRIYMEMGQQAAYHPIFQSLQIPFDDEPSSETMSDIYTPLEFDWLKPGTSNAYPLMNPFQRAVADSVDTNFVTSSGQRKVLGFVSRGRASIEDVVLPIYGEKELIIHCFLYKAVISEVNPALRTSEREWYGRLGPYFPELQPGSPLDTILPQQKSLMDARVTYVKRSVQMMNRLNELIQGEVPLYSIAMAGVKFLRLVWKSGNEKRDLDNLFYELPVTSVRPFLRILPSDGVPITKLKVRLGKIPDLADPRLLLQWAQERNPTPDQDFVFAKTVIRRGVGVQPELYGTLRLFDDTSADFIVLPSKQLRKLEHKSDLVELAPLLAKAIQDTYLSSTPPEIGEASLICGLRLPTEASRVTKAMLRKRLMAFKPLFQEISPLPGEQPLIMLRYKAVSNFATEDRVFTFITQLTTRRLLQGDAQGAELVDAVEDEFQMSKEEAQGKVADWYRTSGQATLMVPETKDYVMTYNKGIDIAIFGQHPFYSFHLYRVDSTLNLERIITALSLIFSADDEMLRVSAAVVEDIEVAAAVVVPETGMVETKEDEDVTDSFVAGQDFYGQDAMFDFDVMDEAVERDETDIRDQVAAEVGIPQEDVEAAVPAAPVPVPAPVKEDKEDKEDKGEETDDDDKKTKTYKKYLIRKLQDADRRLFEYKDKNPQVKIKKYVTMCQATETRQPAVLNQEQYERMKDEYPEVSFIEYPLTKAAETKDPTAEYYTVLKYGSDPARQNYYICSEFFCIKDHIMVREEDFYATKDRLQPPKTKLGESRPGAKDRGSCPFCHGELIKSLDNPGKNQTVIQRAIKKKSKDNKRHVYVGFVKDTPHPEGFYLPCCFTADSPILISDKQFEHIRAAGQRAPEADILADEEVDEEAPATSAAAGTAVPMLDYQVTLARVHRKYIVGPEKFPLKLGDLEGPQIGLLPAILDAYFSQNPMDFVSREFNRMELKPDSKGFLRIGVENRSRYLPDSFLAAIAPAIFRNTAEEVKKRLEEVITPRIFLFLNFGNLLLEFFDPELPEESDTKLRMWASRELNIDTTAANQEAIKRLYKSYHNFLRFLESTTELKEYRQFAQVLALPGLVTPRGIVCIILDIVEDEKLEVRCPPYGYDLEQYAGADICFLLHHYSGVWEPVFYTENRSPTTDPEFPVRHEHTLLFQRDIEAGWPDIVKQRVREFMNKCAAPNRGEFTSQSGIDNLAIIPLGTAIEYSQPPPVGIVRDAYNHIVALTYRAVIGPRSGLVALPVVDDGTIVSAARVYLDWDDYLAAPIDEVIKYYKTAFEGFFSLYPGYIVYRVVKSSTTDKYVAVQLKNGIYIPATDPKDPSIISGFPMVVVTEMEWMLNREIFYKKDQAVSAASNITASEDELKEIYEHLRLTFSNWFSSEMVGPDLRDQIETILFSKKIPLYEQRKRLEIILGKTILSWMDTEIETDGTLTSLLRVDCNLRAEQNCSGRCVWKKSDSKCLLHAPEKVAVNMYEVNGPNLLKNKLIEELLRFPERRKQMMTGSVPTLVSLRDAIQIGDQYIVPETSVAWFDLMRLDWVPTGQEKKKFFEEMSTEGQLKTAVLDTAEQLPSVLIDILGRDDPLLKYIHFYHADQIAGKPPLLPYLIPLGTSSIDLGLDEMARELTDSAIRKLVAVTRRPVIQINISGEEPVILSYGPPREQKGGIPIIFIITSAGPAILSSSAAHPSPILPDDLPSGLREIYDDRITLVFKKKRVV